MPANDLEVFDHLLSDANTSEEIDFLTYARFALKKKRWFDHFAKTNDRPPTQVEIDGWISQIPHTEFEDMRVDAVQYFDSAAREYLAEQIEDEKKNAVEESILGEVRRFSSPWRHLGIALAMAIVAPLILGGMFFLYEHSEDIHLAVSKSSK